MEEIAIEAPFSGPIDIPVASPPAEPTMPVPPAEAAPAPPAAAPEPAPIPEPPEEQVPIAMPPPDDEAPIPMPTPEEPVLPAGDGGAEAILSASPVPIAVPDGGEPEPMEPEETGIEGIEDYDLLYVPDGTEVEEEDVAPAGDLLPLAEETPDVVMSDGAFSDELMSLVDSVFQESSEGGFDLPAPSAQAGPQRTGDQIVVSPLFRDFSVDEMVAVIQGLKLSAFERGDVILRSPAGVCSCSPPGACGPSERTGRPASRSRSPTSRRAPSSARSPCSPVSPGTPASSP
jgi:hypothetical protein